MCDKPNQLRPVVFCGPSGVGKSTLYNKLKANFPSCIAFSISHTTRKPRPGEEHGKDYYFVSVEEMEKEIKENKFVEHVKTYGNYYGTSIKAIKDIICSNKICILDIDVKGVVSVKKTDLDPICIFIKPPSFEDLEKRLVARGTETEESLKKRLDLASKELEFGSKSNLFDHIICNDSLENAYSAIVKILKKDLDWILKQEKNKK